MQPRKRYATKKNICNQEKDMQSRKIYAIRQKEMQSMTKDKREKRKDNSAFQENQAN